MRRFTDLTIRTKITLILMGTSMIAVMLACLAFYALVIDHYRQSYRQDLVSLAKVMGFNCRVSLAFNIPEDAEKTLASLLNHPSIISADIHDGNGRLFASYGKSMHAPEDTAGPLKMHYRMTDTMLIEQDIVMDNDMLGMITLYDDMRSIHAFGRMALITLTLVILTVLVLTFLLASRLRNVIAAPISELVALSREVSQAQDFSLRAIKHGADEVGDLVVAFNQMLGQIEKRNNDLRESEQRFRLLVNQAVDAFFLHDFEGRFVDVNQRACISLGYSREELLTMTVADIDLAVDNQKFAEEYWSRLVPGQPVTIVGKHARKDGGSFPVEVRMGLMELGGEKFIMAMVRDITERLQADTDRHRLEVQLQQAQKMESIGTLAGGIAHDFNNILSPIFGYIELALLKLPDTSDIKPYLGEVFNAAKRAQELVKQILTFSRQDGQDRSPVELYIVVKEALKLLRASIPTNIEIRQNIDQNCGKIMGNPTQIHQILMNLCTNAYHAMRESGGIMAVSLASVEVGSGDKLRNLHLPPGPYVRLEVSDTGPGMSKEILERIFEPYFTTKAKGEGTGMGLSVVHGIIKGHKGHITVYSEPGQGTTFHVYLPVADGDFETKPKIDETAPLPTGNEKVMLVDDEKKILAVESLMLKKLGYQITTFNDPLAALECFSRQSHEFDLVITDMTMPKMTGIVLAQEIMKVRPDIPVIMCTGFSEIINEEKAKSLGIKEYIMKPITMRDLAPAVRSVLDTVAKHVD